MGETKRYINGKYQISEIIFYLNYVHTEDHIPTIIQLIELILLQK